MANPPTHPRYTILVADDEPEALSLFTCIFSAEGAELLPARSGAEALALARRTRLDLVILDVKLPDGSGTEVLRRLRRIDGGVPVIMVSSNGSAETVRASMKLGAFDYLTKPFDPEEIRRIAREALASRAGRPILLRA